MKLFTVRIIPFPNWRGEGDRPVWHILSEAPDEAAAVELAAKLTWNGKSIIPDGAEIVAFPRFL